MMKPGWKTISLSLLLCTACASNRIAEIEAEPEIYGPSPIEMATASERAAAPAGPSLWSNGPTSLFGDRRARGKGDILTVVVEIDDEAEIQNSVAQNRSNNEQFAVNDLFGLPEWANGVLPLGADLNPGVDLNRSRAGTGNGSISRQEEITLRLAARVVDVLPNGHLVVAGKQDIKVNSETRQLTVTGIIRTEDISRLNTITYDKIAEARISYGGRGQVSDMVKPRQGSRLLNAIIPF